MKTTKKVTTVAAQAIINANKAVFATPLHILQNIGYDENDMVNMLANSINSNLIHSAKKDTEIWYAHEFSFLIRTAVEFLTAMQKNTLEYKCIHVSDSGWSHYFKASNTLINDMFYCFAGETKCNRKGMLNSSIKKTGCGYNKVYDLHSNGLSLLLTIGLISELDQRQLVRAYTAV
jgi:uncharacterized membrane protein